jgi:hypothetical protein
MQIIDDFLTEEEFVFLRSIFLGKEISWTYSATKAKMPDTPEEKNEEFYNQQYVHTLYSLHNGVAGTVSDKLRFIAPILDKIKPSVLLRAKVNSTFPTPEIYQYAFHVDQYLDVPFKTAVYYLNTNNGLTVFADGTEVETVANRLVVFDGKELHTGTSATDCKRRVVLNLNWIGGEI